MEQLLKEIPKFTCDAIVIAWLNPDKGERTEIVWVNPAFERMTGYTAAEVIGQSPRMLQGPDTDRSTVARIREKIGKREPVCGELLNYRKDQTPYWVKVNIAPLETSEAEGSYFVSVQRDMTERHALEEELLRAKEKSEAASLAKSAFLAMMSHELRTPLNSILGFVQLLQMGPEAQKQNSEFLANIRSSGDHLLHIIGDILDIAKLESDQFEFNEVEFSLSEELGHAAAAWKSRAEAKGLELIVENQVRQDLYLADKARIRQVLNNVVLNAIKYTIEGHITVRVNERPSEGLNATIEFAVEDTGIGIEAHRLDQIFQPFDRGENEVVLAQEGVGLGLSISLRIISEMKGTIHVESTLGQGSTFKILLPMKGVESADVQDAAAPENTWEPTRNGGLRILVAEDNPMNQRVMGSLLTALGYEFEMVENGKKAVERVTSGGIDLVLMDISMPVMAGDMATRIIRAMDEPFHDIPIVAVTAHAMKGDEDRLMQAGFSAYLPKPIDVKSLARTLQEIADRLEAAA